MGYAKKEKRRDGKKCMPKSMSKRKEKKRRKK
jgi:hypothetical protein